VVFFDTLLNLVALNMYGSSRRAIVSMILTPTSIRIHPYALHPYPLYSIPGMLQQSGLDQSLIQSSSHLGPWATAAPVALAAARRWAWQMMADMSFIRCAETS